MLFNKLKRNRGRLVPTVNGLKLLHITAIEPHYPATYPAVYTTSVACNKLPDMPPQVLASGPKIF